MDPSASLPLTDLAFSILVALKGERLHGYALLKELRARTGRERLRTGTVYAALARLQDDGWVEEAPGGRSLDEDPRRRYYRLTEEGGGGGARGGRPARRPPAAGSGPRPPSLGVG